MKDELAERLWMKHCLYSDKEGDFVMRESNFNRAVTEALQSTPIHKEIEEEVFGKLFDWIESDIIKVGDEPLNDDEKQKIRDIFQSSPAGEWTENYLLDVWRAAKETVTLHHYNGDDRPPIEVDKYDTLQDFIDANTRKPN